MRELAVASPRVPSLARVTWTQIRLLDRSKRFVLLMAMLVAAAAWGQVMSDLDVMYLFPVLQITVVAVAWPLLVWHGETPKSRHYHRSLPVDQVTHDLIKVGVGALYLLGAVALVVSLLLVIALGAGLGPLIGRPNPLIWLNLFTAPLLIYLLLSPVVMSANRPIEALFATLAGTAGLALVSAPYKVFGGQSLNELIFESTYGIGSTLFAIHRSQPWASIFSSVPRHEYGLGITNGEWITATALWLVLAVLLLCGAAYWANRREA